MSSVDIIILSWDRTDETIAAIDSARTQTGIERRIYVVDQGTRPADLERLLNHCRPFDDVEVLQNDANTGVPGGRNQASAMGTGEFIVALDNDAEFTTPDVCQRAAALMDERPDLAALAFRINVFDSPPDAPTVDRSSWSYNPLDPDLYAGKIFSAKNFVGAGHLIRRSVFEEVGTYDARLFFMHEEVDLCERMINAGYGIEYRGELSVRHKVSAEHRVRWAAGRFERHLRNKIYLMIKRDGITFDAFSELLVQTLGGIRVGFASGALKGAFGALSMIPAALSERRSNPYVHRTPATEAYLATVATEQPVEGAHVPHWQGRNKIYQLYCRLRWETDFTADFPS